MLLAFQLPVLVQNDDASYLTSAKLEGRSAMSAPPNNRVLRNSAMAINVADTRWGKESTMIVGPAWSCEVRFVTRE